MLVSRLVVVGLVGLSLAFNVATAEDAGTPGSLATAVEGVSFADIGDHPSSSIWADGNFAIGVASQSAERFPQADLAADRAPDAVDGETRQVELALTHTRVGGGPLDVEFAQRANIGSNSDGDLERRGHGREVRLGQRLGVREWQQRAWDQPTWYLFAASDDEAIAFRDGQISTQERVEVGDLQAGVTMERGPLQASLAYVERKTSMQVGRETYSTNQRFTGVTLTWRH